MDNVSVSKGVFAYDGSYKIGQRKKVSQKCELFNESWYLAYKETWSRIWKAAEEMNANMFEQILIDLTSYISNISDHWTNNFMDEISTAILLTGVNLPDHGVLFQKLATKLNDTTSYITIVEARNSSSLKNVIEEMVYRLMNIGRKTEQSTVRKNQCNLKVFDAWYQNECESNAAIVIIIPDFESFPAKILREFVLSLSKYAKSINFVLIFGVATTLHAVHRSFSYEVTSKLRVQVFHTQTQVKSLSDVLESTVFSTETPFKLTGRAFQLLTDIFLYYDFSVNGFLQGFKLCVMHHFYGDNVKALCCRRRDVKKRVCALSGGDIREIKRLPSIMTHIEQLRKMGNPIGPSDDDFKDFLATLLDQFHSYMNAFLTILKALHCFAAALPNAPLGKQLREVYARAVNSDISETEAYKESIRLLGFLSKEELLSKLSALIAIVEDAGDTLPADLGKNLKNHAEAIRNASLVVVEEPVELVTVDKKMSRLQLKEKLFEMSQKQLRSPYKQAQIELIDYLDRQVFSNYLLNPGRVPANEIFCFNDGNVAKHHIRGSLRASIHTALNNPRAYLECDCCKLDNDRAILPTLPDLSIIYKLHLECRKLINMYDWLQAFLTIVAPNEEGEEQREVDSEMQARFTRAVAELQFLGFIKSSRRKTDHVKRLT